MSNSTLGLSNTPTGNRNRRNLLIGSVAGAATLAGFSLAWHTYQSTGSSQTVEPSFWQLEFATPEGQILHLQSFRGKPLLLNFWASWCIPCVEELPLLSGFYSTNLPNGWQVIGLALDELDPVKRFLARSPVTFPVVMAGTSGLEIARSLGNVVGGLPFTVLLDSGAHIVHRKMGQVTPNDLRAWVAQK